MNLESRLLLVQMGSQGDITTSHYIDTIKGTDTVGELTFSRIAPEKVVIWLFSISYSACAA